MTDHGVDDEQWAEFVENHRRSNARPVPVGAERVEQATGKERRRLRPGLVLGAIAMVGIAGLCAYSLSAGPHRSGSVAVAAPAQPSSPVPLSSPVPSVSAGSVSAGSVSAGSVSAGSASATSASAFQPQYGGYTLVAYADQTDCTGSKVVGPTLAGLITQSHGCLGVHQALYQDAAGDQFNLAMFTMKDPAELPHIIDQLAVNAADVEVGTLVPGSDSGLRQLPADAGMVQSFAGYGPSMLIGVGLWSDGHMGDYNTLEKKLSPLLDAVMKGIEGGKPMTTQ